MSGKKRNGICVLLLVLAFTGCDFGDFGKESSSPIVANRLIQGITFSSDNSLYMSTVEGDILKLKDGEISVFISEDTEGLDYNEHIRYSSAGFYIENVLNVNLSGADQIDEVMLFDSSGLYISKITNETDLSIDLIESIDVDKNGSLYVLPVSSSIGDDILYRFSSSGNQNLVPAVSSSENSCFVPQGLAVNSRGEIAVCTPSTISLFSSEGAFIKTIDSDGSSSAFEFGKMMAFDSDDNLYVYNIINVDDESLPQEGQVLKYSSGYECLGVIINLKNYGLSPYAQDMVINQDDLYIVDSSIEEGGVFKFNTFGEYSNIVVKNN